jgi:uncharacterized Fe-S radical SAM superfamily protein PflX
VLAGYAAVQARKTDARSASRVEMEAALSAQHDLLETYRMEVTLEREKREADSDRLHSKINDALARATEAQLAERRCIERLSLAEARIAELGG